MPRHTNRKDGVYLDTTGMSANITLPDMRNQPIYFEHVVLELRRDTLFAVDSPIDGIRYFCRR